MLPPWHASKKGKTTNSVPKSAAARMAKSRQNRKANRDEVNELLQKELKSEAQERYLPDSN